MDTAEVQRITAQSDVSQGRACTRRMGPAAPSTEEDYARLALDRAAQAMDTAVTRRHTADKAASRDPACIVKTTLADLVMVASSARVNSGIAVRSMATVATLQTTVRPVASRAHAPRASSSSRAPISAAVSLA